LGYITTIVEPNFVTAIPALKIFNFPQLGNKKVEKRGYLVLLKKDIISGMRTRTIFKVTRPSNSGV